jgi:hypothetical protein
MKSWILFLGLIVCSSGFGQEKDTTIEIVRNSFTLNLSYHSSSTASSSSSSQLFKIHFNLSTNVLIEAEKNNLISDKAILNLHFDTTNCKLISIDFHKKSSLNSLNNEIQTAFNEIIQVYNNNKLYLYNTTPCYPENKVIMKFKLN